MASQPAVEEVVESPVVEAPTFESPVAEEVQTTAPELEAPVVQPAFEAPMVPEMPVSTDLPRDMLLAKAKAYREQALKQREPQPEQLSMEMSLDHNKAQQETEATPSLSSPFDQSNLDVPTYLRRRQTTDDIS